MVAFNADSFLSSCSYAGSAARRPAPYEIEDYQLEFEAALSSISSLTQSTLEEEDRTKYLGPSV